MDDHPLLDGSIMLLEAVHKIFPEKAQGIVEYCTQQYFDMVETQLENNEEDRKDFDTFLYYAPQFVLVEQKKSISVFILSPLDGYLEINLREKKQT